MSRRADTQYLTTFRYVSQAAEKAGIWLTPLSEEQLILEYAGPNLAPLMPPIDSNFNIVAFIKTKASNRDLASRCISLVQDALREHMLDCHRRYGHRSLWDLVAGTYPRCFGSCELCHPRCVQHRFGMHAAFCATHADSCHSIFLDQTARTLR